MVRHAPVCSRNALLRQCGFCLVESTGEVGDVGERFVCEGLRDEASLTSSAADDNDTRVVVLHGQASIVLGFSDLADVPAFEHTAAWDGPGTRKRAQSEGVGFARIDHDRGAVAGEDVAEAVGFDDGDATKRTPHGNAELIATDVRVPGSQELVGESLD